MGNYGNGSRHGGYQMDYGMIREVEAYIRKELEECRYYELLAEKAPTVSAGEMLLRFSQEEKLLAEGFIRIYGLLTGGTYITPQLEEPDIPDYREALRIRLLEEARDYKVYGEKYYRESNQQIRDLLFAAMMTEAQHSMTIPVLMYPE